MTPTITLHYLRAEAAVERGEAAVHRLRAESARLNPHLTDSQRHDEVLLRAGYASACDVRAVRLDIRADEAAARLATRATDPAPAEVTS